jgi:TRAP-type mannitol/chloroaromatic compound transport system permease small subunit
VSFAAKLAGGIDAFIDLVGRTLSWLALVVALVMGANVLLRYGFSLGWIWAQELEWHLLVPLTLVGMSYALRHGEHVRVDVLYASFPRHAKLVVDIIASVIAMIFSLLVIVLSLAYVDQSWSIGEGSPNPGGIDYRYIIKAMIPIGFALLFLQSLSHAIRDTLILKEGRDAGL